MFGVRDRFIWWKRITLKTPETIRRLCAARPMLPVKQVSIARMLLQQSMFRALGGHPYRLHHPWKQKDRS